MKQRLAGPRGSGKIGVTLALTLFGAAIPLAIGAQVPVDARGPERAGPLDPWPGKTAPSNAARPSSGGTRAVFTTVPGRDYSAGGVRSFLLGDGYRDLWNTPITVPVLNLGEIDGSSSRSTRAPQ